MSETRRMVIMTYASWGATLETMLANPPVSTTVPTHNSTTITVESSEDDT